jgi:hypothetical protein
LISAYAVARIENDLAGFIPVLARAFDRDAPTGRNAWTVATVFGRLPADYPELLPSVARWMARKGLGLHSPMFAALAKYGPKAAPVVPALRGVLRQSAVPNHHWFVWTDYYRATCELLGAIGPDAKDALPELRMMYDRWGIDIALAARDAIREIEGGK